MATQASILAWEIPWREKPGRAQSMGTQSHTWLRNSTGGLEEMCARHTTGQITSFIFTVTFTTLLYLFKRKRSQDSEKLSIALT